MGIFSWIFGGGNVELVAKSLAKQHHALGNFNHVISAYYMDFSARQPGTRNYDKAMQAAEMIAKKEIKNYQDLGLLALYVDSTPNGYDLYFVRQSFSDEISKRLAQNGIDNYYIYNNALE
ncbi:hypothetical protein Dthio_PD3608 [Desulfonatronospira thiodismutans ASO3-1]|uniref:Uncharacterized protein n=1 Tax=Desulfonatronospira thiodismutans ASO3-1 TaxID=555779 RepID=D6SJV0_9BACT|nr:hypothetical protein [Desulfonatronospira thiodismutans]EFI36153.1 hypothetical protein Dthio_PD3608 [Desulfonatronospira thiodismutans ASO3-1]